LAKMNSMEGLTEVDDSRPIPGIEWQLIVDRTQAGIYGADVTLVGNMVKLVTTGIRVSSYRPDDSIEELDITVRYPASDRNIDELDNLRIMTTRGMVPVSNFVTRTPVSKVGSVVRVDGRRVISVGADVADGVLSDAVVTELRDWLATAPIDPDVTIAFRGEDADLQEAQAFLSQAFLVALFIMAIILVTQFNSFYQAFIILSAIILSTTGVFLGLLIADMPFGVIMSGVGVITLAGVVVNNNIVLIDTYNHLKTQFPPMEAIVRTGAQRMRPVFLTAIVTVLALTPMVFGFNVDLISREVAIGAPSTALWQQLAIAVVSGLLFAAPFTLIVTPCLLAIGIKVSNIRVFGGQGNGATVAHNPAPSGAAGSIASARNVAPAE
jgi:multidrug efflux pump